MTDHTLYPLITGLNISCGDWPTEGALRMLRNNLRQGADPANLVVYGGRGRLARNWDCFHAIEDQLRILRADQTLLIQSGKPVGVLPTFPHAPRVIISNSMLVPIGSTDAEFDRLEALGLMMYGQMTAGSWAYIGAQGIMQGTYETFVAAGARPGTFVFTSGLGNMGQAQAPAGKMCGASILICEVDPAKIERSRKEGWVDESYETITGAVDRVLTARKDNEAIAVAYHGNVVDVLEYLVDNGIYPDIATDQTAAHDPLMGYVPNDRTFTEARAYRLADRDGYIKESKRCMRKHVELLLKLQEAGVTVFDYGNGIRFHARDEGLVSAFDIKGFALLYLRPLFCQGRGPFRVAALSGDARDIAVVDEILLELFGGNVMLSNWIHKVQKAIDFSKQPGLPARVCWLGMGERALAVRKIWDAIGNGRITAPIWVGRDHLDCGSVASPGRETEGMLDTSDNVADWPILNALTAVASGATWVSVHNGGGVGIGKSTHAGLCFVITPDDACLERAEIVFHNDPATGVLRHADAGYPEAIETADRHGLVIPMRRA